MVDKAAIYLKDTHTLKINADFRVFTDMIDHWVKGIQKWGPGLERR